MAAAENLLLPVADTVRVQQIGEGGRAIAEEVTAATPFVDLSISVLNATLAMPSPAAMCRAMKGNPITMARRA